jgi:hypothetical protein
VQNPGVVEIPDERPEVITGPVIEIPEEHLDTAAGDAGQLLGADPAVLTVALGKPHAYSPIRLFPERRLETVLLDHRETKDGSSVWHYVMPELRKPLKKYLRNVRVELVFDTGGRGEPFLWIVPVSDRSPYYAALSRALSYGKEFVATHKFRFEFVDVKRVDVHVHDLEPDDPEPVLPSRPLSLLLPEALKAERIIRAPGHPVFHQLTSGRLLK